MTQQQVFSLYLANPNQRVVWTDENGNEWSDVLEGVTKYHCRIDNDKQVILNAFELTKLELRLIGSMADQEEIIEHDLLTGQIIFESRKPAVRYDDLQKAINEHQNWLITHGYCLDEQWIKNGWVEIEKVKETCPDCGGDGKETCNNPDHAFINAVGGESYRLVCPVCKRVKLVRRAEWDIEDSIFMMVDCEKHAGDTCMTDYYNENGLMFEKIDEDKK